MSFTLLLPLLRPIIQATFQGEVQSLFGNLPWLYLVRNANIIFLFWQENLKGVIKAALKKNILGRRKGAEDQSGHFLMLHCSKLDQKYVFYLSENKFHCLTFLVYALLYVEMYVFLEVF